MANTQRSTFRILLVIGIVYFGLFFYPNSFGARTENILLESSSDEYVTYPIVIRILTPGETLLDTRANLFLYEDYHYGYPFYAYSALVLLPVKIIYGSNFTQNMQLNMLLLRQFTNVLPIIIASGILVYLQTRFFSKRRAIFLFLLLLTIRGVVRSNIWWWHPDSLTVLCVVLTLFFLDRDQFRFGRNFYFAAIACGMATAIKLLGVFFFLSIPVYILYGLIRKKIRFPKLFAVSVLFLILMSTTVIGTNPFLFSDEQRERMFQIQAEKRDELAYGYSHDDPIYYQKGPQWWVSTLDKWYAPPTILLFLMGSLFVGCFLGPRRMLNVLFLSWVMPYSIYVLYFVAVKPDHYWLPVMLPLFSYALMLIDIIPGNFKAIQESSNIKQIWRYLPPALLIIIFVGQTLMNLFRPISGNIPVYISAVEKGIEQLQRIQ